MTAPHDLSVWAVAQTPSRSQRHGRYVRESSAHPGKMLPALAATIIDRYTRPGEMVLDPMCGDRHNPGRGDPPRPPRDRHRA